MSEKRTYTRRTDEDRINDLETQIQKIKHRMEAKQRKDSAVLKDVPKVQRTLRRFAELCMENQRQDLSNSVIAFLAGLERAAYEEPRGESSRRQVEDSDFIKQLENPRRPGRPRKKKIGL